MTAPGELERSELWPALPFGGWKDTCATLHLWTQIVGKVRLALTPWLAHSWHATLYVTARGLTTSPIPYRGRSFELSFDLVAQVLRLDTSDGITRAISLRPGSISDFHAELKSELAGANIAVEIHGTPNEIADPIPFSDDHTKRVYDADAAQRFFRVLIQVDRVFKCFRTGFVGKCSPVHLFWGSFDLAVTRFSGRRAPLHPGGIPHLPDTVTREAYSHEVSSAGFWPGGGGYDDAAFYAYAYPTPAGFATAPIEPSAAFFSSALGEFILPYAKMRETRDPDATLLRFLSTSYEAAADNAAWDRAALECALGRPRIPREI